MPRVRAARLSAEDALTTGGSRDRPRFRSAPGYPDDLRSHGQSVSRCQCAGRHLTRQGRASNRTGLTAPNWLTANVLCATLTSEHILSAVTLSGPRGRIGCGQAGPTKESVE